MHFKVVTTDYKMGAEVYSYSRSRGLFAGISINGADLAIDKKSNAAFYGDSMNPRKIFDTSKNRPKAVKALKESPMPCKALPNTGFITPFLREGIKIVIPL